MAGVTETAEAESMRKHQRALVARDDLEKAHDALATAKRALLHAVPLIDSDEILIRVLEAAVAVIPIVNDVRGRAAQLASETQRLEKGL